VEAVIHAAIALPAAAVTVLLSRRSESAAARTGGVVGGLVAFAGVVAGSYRVLCTSCT
jgi:hypothetical protein